MLVRLVVGEWFIMSVERVRSQGSQVRERAVMVVRMYLTAVMLFTK